MWRSFDPSTAGDKDSDAALEKSQEDQERLEDEALQSSKVERGDTVNALINHRWVSLAIIAFILAVLFDNQTLIAMSAFMLVIVTVAWIWSRNSLTFINYQRRFYHTHVFPNEKTDVEIIVENKKRLPVTWLQVEDMWPRHFAPLKRELLAERVGDPNYGTLHNAYSLRWFERVRRHYEIQAITRGIYEIGPVELISGDPFSLFERSLTRDTRKDYLVIYPEIKTLPELGFPLRDPFGDRRVQRRLFEDPVRVIGVRDYQPHDSFRMVHWKASARVGNLQTKVFEPTRGTTLVIALNIATFVQHWRGVWPDMMEYAITVSASIAAWAVEQDYGIGLISNGALSRSDQSFRILPSRNPNQLTHLLEALAGLKYYVTEEFGRFTLKESPKLPIGATLVMVTPFLSESITTASVRLRDSGRRVVWVALGKKVPQDLHGVLCYHLPIGLDEPELEEDETQSTDTAEVSNFRDLKQRENARQRFLRQKERERSLYEREKADPQEF
jgi:uncharacterized protein (DUF58 family)